MSMRCEFYNGAYQFNYHSTLRMFLSLQLHTWRLFIKFDGLTQWMFNKRSLRSAARLDLMRYLCDQALSDPQFRATPFTWCVFRHGKRVWRRPDAMELVHREKMMLNALVATGDLRKNGGLEYEVLPTLLNSLDAAETEDRRHVKNIRIQIWIGMVALIAALASIAQLYESWLQNAHNKNGPGTTPVPTEITARQARSAKPATRTVTPVAAATAPQASTLLGKPATPATVDHQPPTKRPDRH